MYQREVFVFAETIYTHWLSAIWKKGAGSEYEILPICPWDLDALPYLGACRFSPLTFPVPGKTTTGMSKEQRKEAQKAKNTNRRRRQTEAKSAAKIQRQKNSAFSSFVRRRWRWNCRIRRQRKLSGEEARTEVTRKCGFCRAEDHSISTCVHPGRTEFMKTKWKGRYYHMRKKRGAKRKERKGRITTRIAPRITRCAVCGDTRHNVRTCPDPSAREWRHETRCSGCWETGHSIITCSKKEVTTLPGIANRSEAPCTTTYTSRVPYLDDRQEGTFEVSIANVVTSTATST